MLSCTAGIKTVLSLEVVGMIVVEGASLFVLLGNVSFMKR